MKIALLISGRINTDKNQYENFKKNFLDNNDVDIFVSYPYKYKIILDEFIKLYKPKKIVESDEQYIDVSSYPLYFQSNRHNVMCMFLNRKKVLEAFNEYVLETKATYDCYISMRCDLIFNAQIDFNKCINQINQPNNDIIVAPNTGNQYGGVDDRFAIGTYNSICKYLNVYDNIIKLVNSGIVIHPEMLTLKNLELQDIKLIQDYFNFDINRNLSIL
jgi:hypothetical protein